MNNLKLPELSQKVLLGEEAFADFRKSNRFWFFVLTLILVIELTLVAAAITNNELELGYYIGLCSLCCCIVFCILAMKNKRSIFWWLIFAFITSFVAFIPSYIVMVRLGFKQEWL